MESPLPSPSDLIESLSDTEPSVSLRLNPAKPCKLFFTGTPVAWSEGMGMYLASRPKFTFDPLLHAGAYYVQDASSMVIAHILRRITAGCSPLLYLDACAAPGGKTTAAISSLPEGSLVVANEYVPARASVLKENLVKWGSPYTVVTVGDTARFKSLHSMFDIVAADVPCSGEGMMRKDDEAVSQWSESLVRQCAARQKEIIDNLWESLKPGGWLIYSTCTFNRVENEEMVQYIAETHGAEIQPLEFPEGWGIYTTSEGARFLPHLIQGEGLFISLLRKPSDGSSHHNLPASGLAKKKGNKKADNGTKIDKTLTETAKGWINDPELFDFSFRDNIITALPKSYISQLRALESTLKIIHSGLPIAEIKGRDLIPVHPLALSTELRGNAFPTIDLDLDSAIEYLRKESPSPTLLSNVPKGYTLITYKGLPLGWIKNIGSRANNLYPKEWKIRVGSGGFLPPDA